MLLDGSLSQKFVTFVANLSKMNRFFLILAFLVAFPIMGNAQRKRAFLVGISTYKTSGYKVWGNIHGAEDIALLTPELEKKGFAIQALTNEDATYQRIMDSLNEFIQKSKKGDVIYLHFSCHGQPVEDGMNGFPLDEKKDGWDEALVPIDAGKEYSAKGYQGDKHITDDELNECFTTLRKKTGVTGMLYVAIDACHAGEMSRRGLETVRGTNEGLTKTGKKYNPPITNVNRYKIDQTKDMAPALFIEACRSRERNTEICINKKKYGALSYNICQALKEMKSLDRRTKDLFKANIDKSKKVEGRWPGDSQHITWEE